MSGRIVVEGKGHDCNARDGLLFKDKGTIWECGECGAWWRSNIDSYYRLSRLRRWWLRRHNSVKT